MRIHHVALRTADLPRLEAFYRAVLGLAPRANPRPGAAWLGIGDAVLMLELADAGEPAVPAGSRDLLAFAVDAAGRDAVRARLAARGVSVEHETAHSTYFRDPDGRRVAVSTYPLGT